MMGAITDSAVSPADSVLRKLIIALPDGLSPRTVGFYLAQQEGYYRDQGLTVDFIASGNQPPSRLLADGKADLAVDLMPVALLLHQNGIAIQHVAQFFQHSSLALYCRAPIAKPADLHGTTIGVWFGGEESSFYAWMNSLNISTFGEEDGVTVLRQGRVAEALADSRLDCVTSTSYLAPLQMQAGGITPNSRTVFRYEDLGVGTLEDGLYARAKDLIDRDRLDLFTRFVVASAHGWQKLHDDRSAALRLFRFQGNQDINQPNQMSANQKNPTNADVQKNESAKAATSTSPTISGTDGKTRVDQPTKAGKYNTSKAGTDHQTTMINGIEVIGKPISGPNSVDGTGSEFDLVSLKASLDAVDALVDSGHHAIGQLDGDSYDRTINLLMTGAPEPVLKSAPINAIADILWKRLHPGPNTSKF